MSDMMLSPEELAKASGTASRKRPSVAVAAVLVKDDKVLVSERLAGKLQGKYAAPGGHLEWMETFEEAAVRELREETSIETTVENCEVVGVDQGFAEDEDFCCVIVFVHVKAWVGDPRRMEPGKQGPWEWVPRFDMPEKVLGPLRKMYVKLLGDLG